eukprot:gene13829-biopygen9597
MGAGSSPAFQQVSRGP